MIGCPHRHPPLVVALFRDLSRAAEAIALLSVAVACRGHRTWAFTSPLTPLPSPRTTGDSGLHVLRDGYSIFSTNEQQHYFNCPFQVSGYGSYRLQ